MRNWKNLKVGDLVFWIVRDFDGEFERAGVITEAVNDHVILQLDDGTNVWIDDDTADHFVRR